MSYEKNVKLWHVTYHKLNELYQDDKNTVEFYAASKKEFRETDKLTTIFGQLYLRYVAVVKQLGEIIDEIVQVQLRTFALKIFDGANARLCELKDALCLVALSQFVYLDNFIIEHRLIPHDIHFVTPGHLKKDVRDPEMQELFEKLIKGLPVYVRGSQDNFVDEDENEEETNAEEEGTTNETPAANDDFDMMYTDDDEVKSEQSVHYLPHENPNLPPERAAILKKQWMFQEAVKLIQTCERVRTARILAAAVAYVRKCRIFGHRPKPLPPKDEVEKYVITIQRYWRGFYARKVLAEEEIERKMKIGMLKPSWKSTEIFDKIQQDKEKKAEMRKERVNELKELAEKEETRVLAVRSPSMMEDITDEIIFWMTDWYQRTQWFDGFPTVGEGGSVLIVSGVTKTVEEAIEEEAEKQALIEKYLLDPKAKMKDAADAKKKKKDDAKLAKELRKKLKELEKARRQEEFPLFNWIITKGMTGIQEKLIEFDGVWSHIHLEDNPWQKNYNEFVTEEKYADLNIKLRETVDEIMRIEHMLLIEAVNRDRVKAAMPALPVPRTKGYKKPKKPKLDFGFPPPEVEEEEAPKPVPKKRPMEDMFQELVDKEIICRYPKVTFDDIYSDWNYCAYDRQQIFELPLPCIRDSISALKASCVLPLGSREVNRPKAVMIIGPRKSGKKMMVHAICNETGAVLFDLSPLTVNKSYPGKRAKRMIRLVTRVAKAVQPSVYFFDGAEKPFYKAIPKEEKNDNPKLMGRYLPALQKSIGSNDLMMIISTSNKPWTAQVKKILKLYTKVILVPRLDYGSCLEFWKHALLKIHGISRDFDFSSLAKRTQFYEVPYLQKCVEALLTPTRLCELYFKPLTPNDFYAQIVASGGEAVSNEEFTPFLDFLSKTPDGQKDIRRQEIIQLDLARKRKAALAAAKQAAWC